MNKTNEIAEDNFDDEILSYDELRFGGRTSPVLLSWVNVVILVGIIFFLAIFITLITHNNSQADNLITKVCN